MDKRNGTGDKEIGLRRRCERKGDREARGSKGGRKGESGEKIGEAEEGTRESSRQERIFEYDYTARVNRPVRKRAASYTRNAFACLMVGE